MHGKSKEQVQAEFDKQDLDKDVAAFLLPFLKGFYRAQT
jgi:hypothetical protein